MKIGIVVYSQTGNTLSVAQKLAEKLTSKGHEASIEQIKTFGGSSPQKTPIQFEQLPDLNAYEALVFASPVQAFSLATAMKTYLAQVESLKNKKVACFVTQGLKRPWMGGNKSINTMKQLCRAKGALVGETGIVSWSHEKREDMIAEVTERLSGAF